MNKNILPVFIVVLLATQSLVAQFTQRPIWGYEITNQPIGTNNFAYPFVEKHTGSFYMGHPVYGSFTLKGQNYTSIHSSFALTKIDTNGNTVWHFPLIDKCRELVVMDMKLDASGNCYLYGTYKGDFQVSSTVKLDSNGFFPNIFVLKVNSNGTLAWAEGGSGEIPFLQRSLAVSDNKVYILADRAKFGNSPSYTTYSEIFVLDAADGQLTASRDGIPGYALVSDNAGNCYIIDDISANADTFRFADTFAIKTTPSVNSQPDAVIYSLDNTLTLRWFQQISHVNTSFGQSMLYVNNNMLLLMGNFRNEIVVNGRTITSPVGVTVNKVFLASIHPADGSYGFTRLIDSTSGASESVKKAHVGANGNIVMHLGISGQLEVDGLKGFYNNTLLEMGLDTRFKSLLTSIRPGTMFEGSLRNNFYVYRSVGTGIDSVNGTFYTSPGGGNTTLMLKIDTISFKTGILPIYSTQTTNLYPNPASAIVTFDMPQPNGVAYRIADITGRIVKNGVFEATAEVDIAALPAGIYFITAQNGLVEYRAKFAVQR